MSTEQGVRVSPDPLRELVAAIYCSTGVPEADAAFVADTLVQADLWGHQSHGVLRVGWYYARLRSGAMLPVTRPETVVDAGAIAVVDGRDGVGQVVARHAIDDAVRRARLHGVWVVSVRNSNHFGTLHVLHGHGRPSRLRHAARHERRPEHGAVGRDEEDDRH